MKGENAEVIWDPQDKEEEGFPRANKLIVKQILLGVEAKEGEYNVVEVRNSCLDTAVTQPFVYISLQFQRDGAQYKFHEKPCYLLTNFFIIIELQVETTTKDDSIKIPIAVLKVGENRLSSSFLEFPDAPVTFKLIQGSGPVHIHGHHLLGELDGIEEIDEEEAIDEEDDSDNEIHAEEADEPKSKKQKLANSGKGAKTDKNGKKK